MRKFNAIVTAVIMLFFLIHMIWGGLMMTGMVKGGNKVFSALSYTMVVFICVHVVIAVKLTIDSIIAGIKSGTFYLKDNSLFLTRRISGFALLVFMAMHILLFTGTNEGGVYRLKLFDMMGLISQILMVVSLIVHLVTNIPPLRIALGLTDKRDFKSDVILILSVLLLLSGVAFIVYYIRWQVI